MTRIEKIIEGLAKIDAQRQAAARLVSSLIREKRLPRRADGIKLREEIEKHDDLDDELTATCMLENVPLACAAEICETTKIPKSWIHSMVTDMSGTNNDATVDGDLWVFAGRILEVEACQDGLWTF